MEVHGTHENEIDPHGTGLNGNRDTEMMDVLYVLLTLAFFALTAWYVRGLEKLGGAGDE